MARDTTDDRPLESRAQLIEGMEAGAKPESAWRIGTEHEKFGFERGTLRPIPYEGERGVRAMLEGMRRVTGWDAIEDEGRIIGLAGDGGAISIEPGGQFELSGAPLDNLHETCREANAHLRQVREVADPLEIGFLGMGMNPKWPLADIPFMPKSRYEIMKRYMPKVGGRGLDMMFRTCTIQVNLDYGSEADMVKKMRVGLALQPIATALFANSPFTDGAPNGYLSARAAVWQDLDADRTGDLPFAFEEGFGFEAYADWALEVPMYFVIRDHRYIDMTDVTFRDYLEGRARSRHPGLVPTLGDWTNHLSTVFPEVRLKSFLEMRGADGGPWRRICALPAFWVGLVYDAEALDAAWELCRAWSAEERAALRRDVPRQALKAEIAGRSVQALGEDVVAIARSGLERRARAGMGDPDEAGFLGPVEETLALGRTPAELLLDKYHGTWERSVDPVFSEYAY